MTAYNPAVIERLIAEAREDDARMTPGPWSVDSKTGIMYGDGRSDEGAIDIAIAVRKEAARDPEGIARTRNNLAAITDQLDAARAEIERLRSAAERWSDAREDWQQRQTFSARCTLDEAGDELQAVLSGRAAPAKGERAAVIVGALAAMADPRPARLCPTCGKPGHRPQDHAGWDPSKDMP